MTAIPHPQAAGAMPDLAVIDVGNHGEPPVVVGRGHLPPHVFACAAVTTVARARSITEAARYIGAGGWVLITDSVVHGWAVEGDDPAGVVLADLSGIRHDTPDAFPVTYVDFLA